jgi:hypothetical protein
VVAFAVPLIQISNSHVHSRTRNRSRAMRELGFQCHPSKQRGAWSAARRKCLVSLPASACEANGDPEAHRLAALHCGDFGREDRTSGSGQARRALIRRDFPAFILSSSSR